MAYLQDHQFFDRLEILAKSTNPNHELAESIDRDFTRAALHAAKRCAKKKRHPWSPLLAEAWAEIHFFRLAHSDSTTNANYKPALHHLQNRWPKLPRNIPIEPQEIKEHLQNAIAKLRRIKQQAQKAREDFLLQRAAIYKDIQEQGKSKVIQRIIRAESQKKVYRKIQYLKTQGDRQLGLSSLKIPKHVPITEVDKIKKLADEPDQWQTITVPQDIEQILLHRNKHHFRQAHGTPLTSSSMHAKIGYKADGYAVDLILSGEYVEDDEMTAATSLLIHHLQAKTAEEIQTTITKEEVLGKLKKWKESTITSPSGLHLGHYHCAWRTPKTCQHEPTRKRIKKQQEKLLYTTVVLLNKVIKFGYTFQRWTKVVNVMLQKDPGNPRIHRLNHPPIRGRLQLALGREMAASNVSCRIKRTVKRRPIREQTRTIRT
jgi:hypothetical protein